jgi:integrase
MYYCRAAVPKELITIIGKREIKVSLKTTDPAIARQRLMIESFKVDQQFAVARGHPTTSLPLPDVIVTGYGNTPPRVEGITLHELIERYFAASEQRNLAVKTVLEYGIRFKTIKALLGERTLIGNITRDDCRQFQQTVMLLPPNASKRFPNMKLPELAEHAKRHRLPPMAPKTINQHISCLNLLMEWACRERLLDANPARGLFVEETVKLRDKRDPFSIDQLNQLFSDDLMRSYHDANSARFWVPMLALWTGARLNELCQLRVDDIKERDAVHVMLIHEGNGNRLKTANASRVIPIHPRLIELGFLKYVTVMRQSSKERLFHELSTSVRGYTPLHL